MTLYAASMCVATVPHHHIMSVHGVMCAQVGDRVASQMEQCKAWWGEQTAQQAAMKQAALEAKQAEGQQIK